VPEPFRGYSPADRGSGPGEAIHCFTEGVVMTWKPQDSIREDIVGLPAPPAKVTDLFDHAAWMEIFDSWATDYGSDPGDQTPSQLFDLLTQLRYSTDWKIIRDKFVVSGNPCGLDWPANVTDGFKRLDDGVDDSSTPAEVELFNAAEQKIDPYLTIFLADIHDIQSGKVGDADSETTLDRLDQIDSAKVAEINQRVMKGLKEPPDSKSKGESVEFRQAGEYVLLGATHDPRYLKLVEQQPNYCKGYLEMAEKGGVFSTGKIEVFGSNDPDNFESAIRDFSKKKISFNV
jgi:hypothetical protein